MTANLSHHKIYIFIGKSGSGKGTQAELIKKWYVTEMPQEKLLPVEMGAGFREFFAKHKHYTSRLAKEITARGGLQPVFLTVSVWGQFLIDKMEEDASVLIDGAPRRPLDAQVLDGALEFYSRDAEVIVLDVTDEEAKRRLLARGRHDDTEKAIADRLAWYGTEVLPSLEFLRTKPRFRIHEINGNQTVEQVFADIRKACLP